VDPDKYFVFDRDLLACVLVYIIPALCWRGWNHKWLNTGIKNLIRPVNGEAWDALLPVKESGYGKGLVLGPWKEEKGGREQSKAQSSHKDTIDY
jgi:hypothetical protein